MALPCHSWMGEIYPTLTAVLTIHQDLLAKPGVSRLRLLGNLFLLLKFVNRLTYAFALPATICVWYLSTTLLVGIQISISIHAPPSPREAYTQAFWYGLTSSILYFFCASILLVNLAGYLLGHYTKQLKLTEAQRTLTLQSFVFSIWLAGGAGIFEAVQNAYGPLERQWSYSDALYFCDVTILTIGFGDEVVDHAIGRGLGLPYSIGGIIILGLMISSIVTFARELSRTNITQRRLQRSRQQTAARSVRSSSEAERALVFSSSHRSPATGATTSKKRNISQQKTDLGMEGPPQPLRRTDAGPVLMKDRQRHQHRAKLLILREDKDRFESMRSIQGNMAKFKKWSLLLSSLTALLFLWLVGAAIFWQLEKDSQEWSYFDAVYFCFVSLLSIGYGDFAPKTNAGRPFFVLWSLLAVPFMTILITSLSNTVVQSVRDWTDAIADFTLLAKDGVWHGLVRWVSNALTDHDAQPVIVQYGEPDSVELSELTEALPFPGNLHSQRSAAKRLEVDTEHLMVQKLLEAIKSVAGHVKNDASRTYDYQEWTSLIKLMRFTRSQPAEAEQGLVEWDWLDENGPVAASGNEPAWVLDRLIECMQLYIRGQIHIGDRLEGNDDARARC